MPSEKPSDKPEYRVYRARRGLLRRLLTRDTDRFQRPGAPTPAEKKPAGKPGRPPRERRLITPKRLLKWALLAVGAWLALSLVLFMVSAQVQTGKVSNSAKAALDDGGNLLTSPNTILVLGSDRRPGDPTRGRADTIMLMRYGGSKAARLSIPRDTLVDIPGFGLNKVNAAYAFGGPALMIETLKRYLGIEIHHLIEVDFKGFPKFVDALGGVTMTFDNCIESRFEGRTPRFEKGKNHLNGRQALDVVRIRKNRCAPEESDLTRARRQQKFLEAVKGRLYNPLTFPRLPWVAWRAPRAVKSDMAGPALMALYWDIETSGSLKPRILRPINPGANPLQVSEAEKQAAVERFLSD